MNSFSFFITVCIGLAAANVVKRQATPPPPTLPPMKGDVITSGAPMASSAAPTQPPMTDTQPPMTSTASQPSVPDTPTNTPAVMQPDTSAPSAGSPSSSPSMPGSTYMEVITTQTTQPPAPTTTKKPTIDELVSVDEILEVFGNVAKSDFFKSLPYEDQLLVMEILAGGETGKMTAILESVELKHLLTFMYNAPFKYADPLWRVIFLGYTREEIIAQ